jgi:plastocyanin
VLAALAALVALAAAAGCGGSTGPTGGASGTAVGPSSAASAGRVTIENFAFVPQTLTVTPGTTVMWTNNDSAPHNVVATDSIASDATTTSQFRSATLVQGDSFSFTFEKAGTYYYECSLHAGQDTMHGTIIVR